VAIHAANPGLPGGQALRKMGTYCKAYPINRFREYEAWTENLENLRTEKKEVDGKEVEVVRELTDDSFFYLQENHVVTDGIFMEENVIFDDITPQWVEFCREKLNFKVPVYEPIELKAAAPAEGDGTAGG
jgi:hypothetical protein